MPASSANVGVIYATATKMDHEPVEGGIALFKPFSAQALEQAIAQAASPSAPHH